MITLLFRLGGIFLLVHEFGLSWTTFWVIVLLCATIKINDEIV